MLGKEKAGRHASPPHLVLFSASFFKKTVSHFSSYPFKGKGGGKGFGKGFGKGKGKGGKGFGGKGKGKGGKVSSYK